MRREERATNQQTNNHYILLPNARAEGSRKSRGLHKFRQKKRKRGFAPLTKLETHAFPKSSNSLCFFKKTTTRSKDGDGDGDGDGTGEQAEREREDAGWGIWHCFFFCSSTTN